MDRAAMENYRNGVGLKSCQLSLQINCWRKKEVLGDTWGTITSSWLSSVIHSHIPTLPGYLMLTVKMYAPHGLGPACVAHRGGLGYSRHSLTLEAVLVAGQGGPAPPHSAWEGPGCPGPHRLPAGMGTGHWPWTEGLELGLGRVFPLLG